MRSVKKLLFVCVLMCSFAMALMFSVENTEQVSFDFIFIELSLAKSIWFFLMLAFGVFIGVLASLGWLIKAQRLMHQSTKFKHMNQR